MPVTESIRNQSKVGHYELEKVIGKGNFAVVRLATHTPTKMKVSVYVYAFMCVFMYVCMWCGWWKVLGPRLLWLWDHTG